MRVGDQSEVRVVRVAHDKGDKTQSGKIRCVAVFGNMQKKTANEKNNVDELL